MHHPLVSCCLYLHSKLDRARLCHVFILGRRERHELAADDPFFACRQENLIPAMGEVSMDRATERQQEMRPEDVLEVPAKRIGGRDPLEAVGQELDELGAPQLGGAFNRRHRCSEMHGCANRGAKGAHVPCVLACVMGILGEPFVANERASSHVNALVPRSAAVEKADGRFDARPRLQGRYKLRGDFH